MLGAGAVVKPGDELAVQGGYTNYTYRIVKVKRVTPSGQIVLENGSRFDNRGFPIASSKYDMDQLCLITPEIRYIIKRTTRLSYLKLIAWDKVSDELLDEVVQVLHRNGFDNIQ